MGKYIKKFDTHSDYEDFIETEDFIRPNVSYCVDNKDVHYNSTQTLFAVEFESGKFAFGHADEDELFVATKDGLGQIWYVDANGVITGNTQNVDNVASAIIDGYNEHFGTDINIWTPETKTLQVGDTVPNWNAYEKIELQTRKIAFNTAGAIPQEAYAVGYVKGTIFNVFTNGERGWLCKNDGLIFANSGPTSEQQSFIIRTLQQKGINVDSVINEIVDYEINTYIPNWNEYEKL